LENSGFTTGRHGNTPA
jgi:hypothetical protein